MQGPTSQTKGFGVFSWDSGKQRDFKQENDVSHFHFGKIIHLCILWRRGLKQFPIRSDFTHQRIFGNDWRRFFYVVRWGDTTGFYWVEPKMLNILKCTTKKYPAQNVSSVEVERLWFKRKTVRSRKTCF